MAKGLNATHTVPAPAAAVFAVLADIDQVQQWQPAVQKIHRLSEGPMAKGSKWIETRMTPRGPFVSTVRVTEYEPSKALALKADNRQAEVEVRFELEDEGTATKVVLSSGGRLKGLRSIFSSRLAEQMRKDDGDLLHRLEKQVVANAARRAAQGSSADASASSSSSDASTNPSSTPRSANPPGSPGRSRGTGKVRGQRNATLGGQPTGRAPGAGMGKASGKGGVGKAGVAPKPSKAQKTPGKGRTKGR